MPLVNRIYAYYQDNNDKRQLDLIPLWIQQWRARGWEPGIVGLTQAQLDPRYPLLVAKARKVPCVNPLNYHTANFVRWLAFAAIPVSTPVAIADYDVFPIAPFPPFETPADGPIISFDGSGGPGFYVAPPAAFSRFADHILSYELHPTDKLPDGRKHANDMTIIQKLRSQFKITHQLLYYTYAGWRDRPLCHFGNSFMDPKRPRVDQVREILASLNALRS